MTETGLNTRAAKGYVEAHPSGTPLSPPIYQGTNFAHSSSQALSSGFRENDDRIYTRFGHPTLSAACQHLATLENAEAALTFSSGMAAISTTLMALLRRGKHVVVQRRVFPQTMTFVNETLDRYGVESTFVEATDPSTVRRAMQPNTEVVFVETPSNPTLDVVDISEVATIAHDHGALLLVDSTFASPYLQRPLELGADLSIHSGSKYLGGHSDVLCGVVCGSESLVKLVREMQVLLGGILDPHAAWLLMRGLRTLGVRVSRASETAMELAQFLEQQPEVLHVNYPWLQESQSVDVARKQMDAGGGMISFEVAGGLHGARAFLLGLNLIPIATSLGGVESVAEAPMDIDWCSAGQLPINEGEISPGLVRLSVGLEDLEDLKRDVQAGLAAVSLFIAERVYTCRT